MSISKQYLQKSGKNFSEWFDWIISEAEIYDYGRYPVKGMGVWLPYGFQIRRRVIEIIRNLLDEKGHEEILLPLLIPDFLFKKESEHVRGFEGEVFWVTRAGLEDVDVKLALRPTSETAISYMESLWIKSYRQLPKKYYQVVSVFRYETKMTKPMTRVREITTFKEAHTVHEDFEDSERQIIEAVEIYKQFFDSLGIPYIISRRPQWDKFAGALYTIAFDTLFPDKKAVQIGTVHNLGQTFTSVFDVKIQKRDESIDYAWQTSYGISERVIASIIAFHSDDKGLVLPPNIAPYQVVIVPIYHQDVKEKVIEYCSKVAKVLREHGLRVFEDYRDDLRPVDKFFKWELKGVPIRIEIGFREVSNGTVTIFRRDVMRKEVVFLNQLVEKVTELLNEILQNVKSRAWKEFLSSVKLFNNFNEAINFINEEGGIAILPWCGDEKCVRNKLEGVEGISALGEILIDSLNKLGISEKISEYSSCAFCNRKAKTFMSIAKKY
ncbi:proline--tRNA ligase [Ignisphaera sp. 4213-co]|uniref:Proline--tRNA ligase n=1 Tax=Ignisphaera cupida TaxID=3050454 RepID=A0ABD4Z756_9CREN|nr:proline--tRNA ligase [Ignisphaera sp. 4213-co]MDK6029069.1 proline--tRNA ligase [Ignisphaera sp. 4213-co]